MACGTAPKVHIRPSQCKPEGGIYGLYYTGDDVDYTYGSDANSIDTEALITDIVLDVGEGFYQIAPHKEGDAVPTFTFGRTRGDDGTTTVNQELVVTVNQDTPEIRAFGKKMMGKVIDLLTVYNGDYEYKYEIAEDMELVDHQRQAVNRRNVFTFRKVNPDNETRLVFKTDEATTKTLIENSIAA